MFSYGENEQSFTSIPYDHPKKMVQKPLDRPKTTSRTAFGDSPALGGDSPAMLEGRAGGCRLTGKGVFGKIREFEACEGAY